MAGYTNLIEAMQAVIKRNGREEITGQILQDVIRGVILELGAGAQFGGIATTETEPGTPDYDIAYIAGEGEYTNFGGLTVPFGSIGVITNKNGTEEHPWSLTLMEIPTNCMVVESVPDGDITALNNHYYNIEDDVEALNLTLPTPTAGRTNEIKVHFIAGFTPTLNIDGGDIPVIYPEIELKHHREYELAIIYNGSVWNVTAQCLTPENSLTFQSVNPFTLSFSAKHWNGDLEYSTNGINWQPVSAETICSSANNGLRQKIMLRGVNNTHFSESTTLTTTMQITGGDVQCVGNINTLLNHKDPANTTIDNYCFYKLFENCANLTVAPELPATTLAQACYADMFFNCTALTVAPELPATELAQGCYFSMFVGCTALITAPALPATELTDSCYEYMFYGCTALTTAPELPATTMVSQCFYGMFRGCTALTTAPELPATTLADLCYYGMFYGCTSLTTAPELPATELAQSCYQDMFRECSSLATAPELPATTMAKACYASMFRECSSLATAPELPATELAEDCYNSMFYLCTSLTTAPELPATTIAKQCYANMFAGCTALTTAPELPAEILAEGCYLGMFNSCTALTTAPVLPSTGTQNQCYYYMFAGCTALTTANIKAVQVNHSNCFSYMFYLCSSLSEIKLMFATKFTATYATSWVAGVSSTGTFTKKSSTTISRGDNGIPRNWTIVNV